MPGSVGNVCNWDDPELNPLVGQIKALTPGVARGHRPCGQELQELTMSEALVLYILFGLQNTAYNPDRVADVEYIVAYTGQPEINVFKAYVKK